MNGVCGTVGRARVVARATVARGAARVSRGAKLGRDSASSRAAVTGISSGRRINQRRVTVCSAGTVQKLTTQELEVAISSRDKPMVIDFFATWCGPCVMLSKVLDQLAAELGESVQFVKVDTDEEAELASYFQIQGLPTLMFIGADKGGKVLRAEGLLPADQIKKMIEDVS